MKVVISSPVDKLISGMMKVLCEGAPYLHLVNYS